MSHIYRWSEIFLSIYDYAKKLAPDGWHTWPSPQKRHPGPPIEAHKRPKTANVGSKSDSGRKQSGPEPARWSPRATEDRQHKLHERLRSQAEPPRTVNVTPQKPQDRQHKLQERLRTDPQASDRAPAREISAFSSDPYSKHTLQSRPKNANKGSEATQDRQCWL